MHISAFAASAPLSLAPAPHPAFRSSQRPQRRIASAQPPRTPARMSLSTPLPPPLPSRPEPAPEPRENWVTELTSVEELDQAFDAAAGEMYTSVAPDGSIRERPVLILVEAYSQRCRACMGVKRAYEKVAEQQRAAVRCFRFDAFEVSKLAKQLSIRAMPTFVLYKWLPVPGDKEGAFHWKRVDHFSTSKRSVLEQNVLDNL